jgi:hypothetical protein
MHVYLSSDPYWCMPEDLANFGVLRQELQLVQSVAPSEFDQCQSLSSFVKAVPMFASLLDKECPTILVLAALKRQGWRQDPSLRPLTHCSDNQHVRLCDSRGGPSIKFYLQCLLDLPKSLGLTSRMPSNCRQSYYRCILLGRHVEASMTDRECRAALLGLPVEAVAPMAPIEDGEVFELAAIGDSEDIPAPIADGGDGIALGGGVVAPLPKAKAKGKKKPVEKGFCIASCICGACCRPCSCSCCASFASSSIGATTITTTITTTWKCSRQFHRCGSSDWPTTIATTCRGTS